MAEHVAIWLISVLIASLAQVMLKMAANREHSSKLKEYLNPLVISAYAIFLLSTLLTMYALKVVPYSYSPVIESMSYIFVPVLGTLVLKEKISRRRILGIIVMLIGVLVFALP